MMLPYSAVDIVNEMSRSLISETRQPNRERVHTRLVRLITRSNRVVKPAPFQVR